MSDSIKVEKLREGNIPYIFNLTDEVDQKIFKKLKGDPTTQIVDSLQAQIDDLNQIPQIKEVFNQNDCDVWIYFPWRKTLLHSLNKDWFLRVKSSRNLFILNTDEQNSYYSLKIGIAGLSVGYSIASVLALENGCGHLNIADPDVLNLSNLNRINTSLINIGRKKADIARESLFEINPFLTIKTFEQGITENNVKEFVTQPKLDIVIEETDDLTIKYLLRKHAKIQAVPLLMFTTIDTVLVLDFEDYRYKNVQPFHGKLSKTELEDLSSANLQKKADGAIKILGREFFSERVRYTFSQLGKKVNAFPQLASGAYLRASAASLLLRKVFVRKENVPSGRYVFDLNELISK